MATQFSEVDNPRWKRPFFTIWIGQAVSLLGSQLVQFALVWYLTRETGSAVVLTTATLVAMLPQVILGPIAGSMVDRGNRRRFMILADGSIALLTLGLAALFATGLIQIWHIYVVIFLRSLAGGFHGPAFIASTSLMVPKEQLSRIQGLKQMLNGGLGIFAAPMGALLLELLPMQGILAIDVVTALFAVGSLFLVAIPQPERTTTEDEGPTSVWQDIRAGLSYVATWRGLLIVLLMATLINFLLTPASSLSPLYVTNHFGGGAQELAWLQSASGIGVVVGGLALSVWGGFQRRVVTAMAGLIGMGAGMLVMGFAPANAFPVAVGAMLVGGLMQPIVNGSLGAILQATVDPDMQGRVFTLVFTAATAISPLGLVIAGPLSEIFGIQTWYILGGLICALAGVFGFLSKSVMSIEEGRDQQSLDASQSNSALKAGALDD
ncbi:MAG: MFS transporter [Proteobacteria bacterium]|nr:MFS transporter [Pseudomonadota bacterium]